MNLLMNIEKIDGTLNYLEIQALSIEPIMEV